MAGALKTLARCAVSAAHAYARGLRTPTETKRLAVAAGLPNDVLAIVLGRLPTRSLAASRCVCRAWRDLIDGRRLLLPHLLPHKVSGLFLNYIGNAMPHYFTRPAPAASGGARVDGGVLDAVVPDCRHEWAEVNGLVLYSHSTTRAMYVCNPATQRWARMPPSPPTTTGTRGSVRAALRPFAPGRSEEGVYLATVHQDNCQLLVWILKELRGGMMEWVTKHQSDLKPCVRWTTLVSTYGDKLHTGPWILHACDNGDKKRNTLQDRDVEWSSDEDNIVRNACIKDRTLLWKKVNEGPRDEVHFLGFHPYKEHLDL
ncbi:hypothetical protein ACP70R_008067 [Stipagrostis hirtigluma subsp. patula]